MVDPLFPEDKYAGLSEEERAKRQKVDMIKAILASILFVSVSIVLLIFIIKKGATVH